MALGCRNAAELAAAEVLQRLLDSSSLFMTKGP
jgi:hypothetical protein